MSLAPDYVTLLLKANTFLDNQALARKIRGFRVTHLGDFPLRPKPIKTFVPAPRA